MIVKLLTEHHLEFLSLKGGCTRSSESTLVKMPQCWKSLVAAHIYNFRQQVVACTVINVIVHNFIYNEIQRFILHDKNVGHMSRFKGQPRE